LPENIFVALFSMLKVTASMKALIFRSVLTP